MVALGNRCEPWQRGFMSNMLIFGIGYTSGYVHERLLALGWQVTAVRRVAGPNDIAFDDRASVENTIKNASHILSSTPPDSSDGDAVLRSYGEALSASSARWIGYLSSTGVYGDCKGAWVDEDGEIAGRRSTRNTADLAWQAIHPESRVFRLPGIYGPGRSMLDRIVEGKAHRIDLPDQVFSRIHVEDIVSAIIASFDAPAGLYNIADDQPCSQNALVEYGCALLGSDVPPMRSLEQSKLSPQTLSFYAENRRVSNTKAKRLLGWQPTYPDFRSGLRACMATANPAMTNADPNPASSDQR
jgi:nucleoside-diphosphate-sugar epimerase